MKRAFVRSRPLALALLAAFGAACGGAQPGPPPVVGALPEPVAAQRLAATPPDAQLKDAKSAVVGAQTIPMDGVAEGLAWPALRTALARKPGEHAPLVIGVARDVPVALVLRAVWTLRDLDLRVQTPDGAGAMQVLELRPKPESPASAGCHLAVFVAPGGDLRIAAPGGPRSIAGPDAPSALARALVTERARCALRYVAFGAESPDASWGSVFDVAWAVDRDKSAGDARYVLGEPVRLTAR